MRRANVMTLGAAAIVAAGCTTSGAGALAPPAPSEQQTLHALRQSLRGPFASSATFVDDHTHNVAVAVMKQLADPAIPQVVIYRWDGHQWQSAAQVVLDVGGSVSVDGGAATPIRSVELTPATPPDLLVTVHYNAGPSSAVISKYGGTWHALTFHGGLAQDGDERFDVRVGPNHTLTSQENDCVPDCAQGHLVTTTYRFSAQTGRLEAYTNR